MQMIVPVRAAAVIAMRGTAALTALVPAGNIYGERVPDNRAWPFIRVQPPFSTPFRATCYDGEQVNFTVSVFAKGPSMDAAAAAAAQVKAALDGSLVVDGVTTECEWTGGNIVPDPAEPDAWHAFSTFTVR